ncbi:hypothetical protein ACP2YL_06750 [Staphylococcus epidermidis]
MKSLAYIYDIDSAKKGHNIDSILKTVEKNTKNLCLPYTKHYINSLNKQNWFEESPNLDITRYPNNNKFSLYSHSQKKDINIQISLTNLLKISIEIKNEFEKISDILEEDLNFFK